MIGLCSGKVIAYGTRNKRCATCEAASRMGKEPREHDCRFNWTGSSKAMEADVAAALATSIEKDDAQVVILVGDEDSSTIKKVRESVEHDVAKWSDVVHAKRSFGSSLYSVQSKYKGVLTNKVIDYLTTCFSYALKQNKGDSQEMEKNLKAIVPHAFGDHDGCGISWCGFLKNPNKYQHSSLPYGKDLHGDKLKEDLTAVVNVFVENVEKLAPLGSSQANESLNNTIGSKAPKIHHYGSSDSNDFRVACAISQKNLGHNYIPEVSKCCS